MTENSQNTSIKWLFEIQKGHSSMLRKINIESRKASLKKLKRWILAHRTDFYQALHEDFGKSTQEVDLSELHPVVSRIHQTLSNLSRWAGPQPVDSNLVFLGTRAYVKAEPMGVCLIISPWNYPVNLALGPLVSAIAAGNTVILKPSEYTPATNSILKGMIEELFEPKEVAIVLGGVEEAKSLLKLPFDHIYFTGSPAVGKVIMESAAKNLSSITLELGGKSPTIVDATAHLADSAKRIVWGKWLNAGQTCVAPDYILLQESVRERFLKFALIEVKNLFGNKDYYTRIINRKHFSRLKQIYEEAVGRGAQVELAADFNEDQNHISPAVLSNVPEDCSLMQEEIFGPILPIMTFTELQEAITFINNKPKPLALYHFSSSKKNQQRVQNETSSGTAVFNDCVLQFSHPNLPFGGVNNSGLGRGHGREGFMAFSNQKSILKQKKGWTIPQFIYPPYTKWKNKIIDIMLKYF